MVMDTAHPIAAYGAPEPLVEEREADSPLVAKIRRVSYAADACARVVPDGCWDILIIHRGAGPVVVLQTGQIAAPLLASNQAGDEILTIAFRPEVYMPRLPGQLTLSKGIARPVEADRRFWVDAERLEIPSFDNAEQLVAAMLRKGLLERDPVVALALRGAPQRLDERSVQRHFARVTGLSLKGFRQIARAHEAAQMLRRGDPPAHVAAELGFSDQAHLSHSVKRFLGQTPGQIAAHATAPARRS